MAKATTTRGRTKVTATKAPALRRVKKQKASKVGSK
jgi:hypothetical protein